MAYTQKKRFTQKWFAFGNGLLIGIMVVLSSEAAAIADNGSLLQYQWRLLQQPANSALVIKNSDTVAPEFSQFHSGRYTFELVVKEPPPVAEQNARIPTSVDRVPATGGLQVGPFSPTDGEAQDSRATEQADNVQQSVTPRSPAGRLRSTAGGLEAQTVLTSILLESATVQQDVPVTFGHIFAKGDVPAGHSLRGRWEDGSSIDIQVDHKASYDDGSLRHAIISAKLDTLQAGKRHQLGFILAADQNHTEHTTPAQLLNQGFQASVEVVMGGQRYTASPMAAMSGSDYKTWLRGRVVNEWLVVVPFKTAAGMEHAHLMARFYVRAYAGGQVRVSTVVENNWAFEANPSNLTYDLNVKLAGRSVYQENALTHYHHARWRKVFWANQQDPQVMIRHNADYMMASKAIPNYDRDLTIPESALVKIDERWQQGKGMMDVGSATHYMPGTGAHDDIGPLPLWTVSYLLSMDPRARQATLGTGELAGSWSIHYRDRQTGLPVSLDEHPHISTHPNLIGRPIAALSAQAGARPVEYLFNQSFYFPQTETEFWQGDTAGRTAAYITPLRQADFAPALLSGSASATPIAACQGDCALRSGYRADTAHQPSLSYIPYLVTGDYYHLEELQFWATGNLLGTSPESRGNGLGLVKWQQIRGQAWSMRTLGDAAFITPDDDPMKAYFIQRVKNNLDFYNENMTDNAAANKLGFLGLTEYAYQFPYNKRRGMAPWQDDFFTWSIGHLAERGFSDAERLLHWKAKFPVGRMMDPGYCWAFSAAYTVNVRDSSDDKFYDSFATMYENTIPAPIREQVCASQAMVDANNTFLLEGTPRLKSFKVTDSTGKSHWESEVIWDSTEGIACVDAKCSTLYNRKFSKAKEIGGFPESVAGFPANMQPALAIAADFGASQGRAAWNKFETRSIKPDYSAYPNWAIIPR